VDQALDIATNRITSAAEAIRQRYRYRCPNDDCRAFVLPCLGRYRRYFRHEEGARWCPQMVDGSGEGESPDDRVGRVRRLVPGNGGWTVVPSQLNVVTLSCALTHGPDEQHVFRTERVPIPKHLLFMDPDYGGMLLAESFPIYPGETHYHLSHPGRPGLPSELGEAALPPNIEAVVDGTWLTEVQLPKKWDTEHTLWAVANGFNPATKPRLHVPDELLLGGKMSKGSSFSAIFSDPEITGHYLSLFIGAPVEAGWSVSAELKNAFSRNEMHVIEVIGLFLRGPSGEVYVRAESDLGISGQWLSSGWEAHSEGKQRAFVIHVTPKFLIHGHIVVTDS
jgi:hypothetical protein